MKKRRTDRESQQLELNFPRHGGARKNAGRKPKGDVAGPSHAKRPSTPARFPLLVTHRLCAELPSLRHRAEFAVVRAAIAENSQRDGMRIVHFTVQSNHLHYLCEARDAKALTSGMRSLGVKLAQRLNQLWHRTGRVFADRFHARALETPNEVHHALAYVLNNARKQGIFADSPDPFSSGPWFDGWKPEPIARQRTLLCEASKALPSAPVAAAGTWLLRVGWRRHGLIDEDVIPGGRAARRANAREEALAADLIQRSLAAAALEAHQRQLESALVVNTSATASRSMNFAPAGERCQRHSRRAETTRGATHAALHAPSPPRAHPRGEVALRRAEPPLNRATSRSPLPSRDRIGA